MQSEEQYPKFNHLSQKCPKSYAVKIRRLFNLSNRVDFLIYDNALELRYGWNRKLAKQMWLS